MILAMRLSLSEVIMALATLSYEEMYSEYVDSVPDGEVVLSFIEYLEALGVRA